MKLSMQAILLLAPVFLGFFWGWLFSNQVAGHQMSGSGGWFDMRGLDPVTFFFQDLIIAVLFGLGAGLVGLAIRGVSGLFLSSAQSAVTACTVASLLVTVLSINKLNETAKEKAATDVKARQEMAVLDAQTHQSIADAFTRLGWIRYPNVRKDSPGVKDGFQIQGSTATFAPADDMVTVINYYLSKCDSWMEETNDVRIVATNQGVRFVVQVPKVEGSVCKIFTAYTTVSTPLLHEGPGHWPPEAPPNPPESQPKVAPSTPPDQLIYPDSRTSLENGSARLYTTDEMSKVVTFYRSAGAQQTDTAPEGALNHTFEFSEPMVKWSIKLDTASLPDGTSGTLVVIQGGTTSP